MVKKKNISINFFIINKNNTLKKIDDVKFVRQDSLPSFTFDIYLKHLYDYIKKDKNFLKDKNIEDHLLFSKLFNRSNIRNSWVQILDKIENNLDDENYSIQIYKFLSENIFHYEENIDITKYNLISTYFYEEIFCKNIDTLQLYDYLIKRYINKEKKFGINLDNVIVFLKRMREFIELEKDFYIKNKSLFLKCKISKKEFFKELYPKDSEKTKERNKLAHMFEYTLEEIQ